MLSMFFSNINVTGGRIEYPTWQLLTFVYLAVILLLSMIVEIKVK
jgi:hypothetical protein